MPKDPSEFWYTVANFTEPNVIELEGGDVDVDGDVDGEVARRPFAVLGAFMLGRFALAYSTATVERCFSVVNYVKNKHRNRLAMSTLDAIVRVRSYLTNRNVCCHNFKITDLMLRKFNSKDMYGYEKAGAEGAEVEGEEDDPAALDHALLFMAVQN